MVAWNTLFALAPKRRMNVAQNSANSREWRGDLNSVTLCFTWDPGNGPCSLGENKWRFELTVLGSKVHVNHCKQTRNSSPRFDATSCFEFKSGRQDTVRTFLPRHCRAANIATAGVQSCCDGIRVICLQDQYAQLARSASRIGRNTDACNIGWRSYLGGPPPGAIPKHLPWAGSSCEDSCDLAS